MSRITQSSKQEQIEQFVERAKEVYRAQLAAKLEPAYIGKIVAIEPETGGYGLGENEVEAARQARATGHHGPFFFLRVGSAYTHRWMTPRR